MVWVFVGDAKTQKDRLGELGFGEVVLMNLCLLQQSLLLFSTVVPLAGSLVILSPLMGLFGIVEALVFVYMLPLHHQ